MPSRSISSKKRFQAASGIIIVMILMLFVPKTSCFLESNNVKSSLSNSLISHNPINITSDGEFSIFPGLGTDSNPYIIEFYSIITEDVDGIFITNTTKHFVIQNCYIESSYKGIRINDVEDGTVTIFNNTITNSEDAIHIVSSPESSIINNTCNNNEMGIYILQSRNSVIDHNTFNHNAYGIYVLESSGPTITNNTCENNIGNAIFMQLSGHGLISDNICYNNNNGMNIWQSFGTIFAGNIFRSNELNGISLIDTGNCEISNNLFYKNQNYGIIIYDFNGSEIHHNTFAYNGVTSSQQVRDDTGNTWFDEILEEGNFWEDWSGIGNYTIFGTAGAVDPYPLEKATIDPFWPKIREINHSPASPSDLDFVQINATVIDYSGVQSVTLNYRINEGAWFDKEMLPVGDDIFTTSVGTFNVGNIVEFYINAVDDSQNHNEGIADNNGKFYSILISNTNDTTISLAFPLLFTLSILLPIVILKRKRNSL